MNTIHPLQGADSLRAAKKNSKRAEKTALPPTADAILFTGNKPSASKWSMRKLALALPVALGIGGGGALLPGKSAEAAISPQSEAIVSWASGPLKGKAYAEVTDNEWNNLRMAFLVTDDTKEKDMHALRMRILRDAPQEAGIPLHVVETAIYTAGVYAAKMDPAKPDEAAHRREITDVVERYTTNVISDTRFEDGSKSRTFGTDLSASEGGDMRETARVALARAADSRMVGAVTERFLQGNANPQVLQPFMDQFFAHLPRETVLPDSLQKRMMELVYTPKEKPGDDKGNAALKERIEKLQKELPGVVISVDMNALMKGGASGTTGGKDPHCGAPSDALSKLAKEFKSPKLQCFDAANGDADLAARAIQLTAGREVDALDAGQKWGFDSTLPAIAQNFARRD